MAIPVAPDPLRLLDEHRPIGRHRDAIIARVVGSCRGRGLTPGDSMPEGAVARWLSVDQHAAREALIALSEAGVLSQDDDHGFRVAGAAGDMAEAIEHAGHQVCMAAVISVHLMSQPELTAASALAQQVVTSIESARPDSAIIYSVALSRHFVACSRSRVVQLAFAQGLLCWDLPELDPTALESYRAVRDAVRQGDAEYVESLLRRVRSLS